MNFASAWILFLGATLSSGEESTGIKITIQHGASLRTLQTIYLQADRKRMEFRNSFEQKQADGSLKTIEGPPLVGIARCDLGQSFELNLETREYTAHPYPPKPFTKEELEARGLESRVRYVSDQPTLRLEMTTMDTGERKEIFGRTARHVITTRKQIPLEGSRSHPQESVTDGWYIDANADSIDLRERLSCDPAWRSGKQGHAYATAGKPPWDKPEFVTHGEPETGFALQSVMTTKGTYTLPDGTKKQFDSKQGTRVTELDEGPLDPALFEIPPGFKQVDRIERNPPSSAFAAQPTDFGQRVRASFKALFNLQ